MNEPIVLAEYGEQVVELSAQQERSLRTIAQHRLSITPHLDPGRWRIKATSYVGTLVVPGARILVCPKVTDANLFHLLEAGDSTLDVGPEQFEYGRTRDLVAAFATFYARHLERALALGVVRQYVEVEERLLGVRGRVDLPAQRRSAGLALPVHCRFDEYSIDTQLNRLLRAAALVLARLPGAASATRAALVQLIKRLDGVGDVATADLRTATVFTRLEQHCRSAERLARLVLENSTLQHRPGADAAGVFMVDMNKVFETFIEVRLRHYLRHQVVVAGQRHEHLDEDSQVTIKPDLVISSFDGSLVYVADAKYKLLSDGPARNGDYYQLLAYLTALGLEEGLLVYCQHDGSVPPHEIIVQHAKQRLRTWAVRLDGTATDVETQLQSLAKHVLERLATGPCSTGR